MSEGTAEINDIRTDMAVGYKISISKGVAVTFVKQMQNARSGKRT